MTLCLIETKNGEFINPNFIVRASPSSVGYNYELVTGSTVHSDESVEDLTERLGKGLVYLASRHEHGEDIGTLLVYREKIDGEVKVAVVGNLVDVPEDLTDLGAEKEVTL